MTIQFTSPKQMADYFLSLAKQERLTAKRVEGAEGRRIYAEALEFAADIANRCEFSASGLPNTGSTHRE